VDGYSSGYVATGMTFKSGPAGEKHLLLNTGTYEQLLYEVAVPTLNKIENEDHSMLDTAALVREWTRIMWPNEIDGETITANGGFWFDDSTKILYWTHFNSYYTGADFPVLSGTRLNDDGTVTNLKYWYLPDSIHIWKAYWQGAIEIPKTFADQYTGGRTISLGYGGCYSIIQTASRGPSIGAIPIPSVNDDSLDVLEVLCYDHYNDEAAIRDGNFFNANTNIWGYTPSAPWDGKFTYGSNVNCGVFIDLPDKKGYIAFVKHKTGRIGYDWGGSTWDSHHEYNWYFYDLEELGEAALGNRDNGTIQPHSIWKPQWPYPLSERQTYQYPSGACFDHETRLLYVYVCRGLDSRPVVHVYRVKETSASIDRKAAAGAEKDLGIDVFPNPFSTSVDIFVRHPSHVARHEVRLGVFNIAGKMVANIKSRATSYTWHAQDHPSGIYMIRVKTGGKVLTKRMVLSR
jgi:hypothetical protein